MAAAAFFLLGAQCACLAQDKIIAVVNNEVITQRDLDDFINFNRIQMASESTPKEIEEKIALMKPELLDKLIEDRIILQEARKNKVAADENRVKARIEDIKKRYGSEQEFREALSRQGLVPADIQRRLREQMVSYLIVEAMVRSRISVKPNEVTDYYTEHNEEFRVPGQRDVDAVTVTDEETARRVVSELKSGKNIDEIGKETGASVDKMMVQKGQLRPDIDEALFAMQPQDVSQPFSIDGKYYIFRLNRLIPAAIQTLPQVRDKIYAKLFNKKMDERLKSWLNDLKKKSYIKKFSD